MLQADRVYARYLIILMQCTRVEEQSRLYAYVACFLSSVITIGH